MVCQGAGPLTEEDEAKLIEFMKDTLGDKVKAVKVTNRLVDSPAVITGHESASLRRMNQFVQHQVLPMCCVVLCVSCLFSHHVRLSHIRVMLVAWATYMAEHRYYSVPQVAFLSHSLIVMWWPQVLEINPAHPIIRGLWESVPKDTAQDGEEGDSGVEEVVEDVSIAPTIVNQLFDNAMITAGLVDDPRRMLGQLNDLMLAALRSK